MEERNYQVQTKINRPVGDVFDAIVNDELLQKYFTDRSSGPLAEGQTIVWHWSEWGDYPVEVKKITIEAKDVPSKIAA